MINSYIKLLINFLSRYYPKRPTAWDNPVYYREFSSAVMMMGPPISFNLGNSAFCLKITRSNWEQAVLIGLQH